MRSPTLKIDADEKELLESVERGDWKSVAAGKRERARFSRIAAESSAVWCVAGTIVGTMTRQHSETLRCIGDAIANPSTRLPPQKL